MAQKNILLLIPNLDFGGAQRSFSKLSLELAKEHNVYVGVFNTFEGIAYPFGGTLINLNIPGSSALVGKLFNFYKRIQQVKKLKKEYKIDIAISFLEGADYVNLLSKTHDKILISIRGSKLHDGEIKGITGWFRLKLLMPYLYQKADTVVAVSEGIRQEMISAFNLQPNKVNTIYNFYEIEAISKLAKQPIEPELSALFNNDHQVIINSGRLHIQKGQAALINVFADLIKAIPAKLVILGDGPLREELIRLAESLNLKTYHPWGVKNLKDNFDLYFLGYQENPFKYISKSTVFAFSSAWEGFPNALAEAMACEVPVISTDCQTGPREILAPGTSLKIDLKDAEYALYGLLLPVFVKGQTKETKAIWVKHLSKLLKTPSLVKSYQQKAQERILDFTKNKILQDWLEEVND